MRLMRIWEKTGDQAAWEGGIGENGPVWSEDMQLPRFGEPEPREWVPAESKAEISLESYPRIKVIAVWD